MNKITKLNWISLGELTEISNDFSDYGKDIGIYRASLDNVVVYIGKATELNNGGFRKRLRDYTRLSPSARNYYGGKQMYENRDRIKIEIIIFSRSIDSISDIEDFEKKLIGELKPIWNTQDK